MFNAQERELMKTDETPIETPKKNIRDVRSKA
jgi:hypothetical protein